MMTTASSGMGYAMRSLFAPGPRVRLMMARSSGSLDPATALAEYVDRGALRPVVEGVYPPEGIVRLHRGETATDTPAGKRVVTMLAAS